MGQSDGEIFQSALVVDFTESEDRRLGPAADSIVLPESKPRAMGELLVVLPIGSREVACAQRSGVPLREEALQPLDVINGPFNIHWASVV